MCHFICVMRLVLILAATNRINTLVSTNAQSRNIYKDVPAVWFDITQFSIMIWQCKPILYISTEAEKSNVITVFNGFIWSHTPRSLKCTFPGLYPTAKLLIPLPLPHKHIELLSITSYLPVFVNTKSDKHCCRRQLVIPCNIYNRMECPRETKFKDINLPVDPSVTSRFYFHISHLLIFPYAQHKSHSVRFIKKVKKR
jgi:hypothetical protein